MNEHIHKMCRVQDTTKSERKNYRGLIAMATKRSHEIAARLRITRLALKMSQAAICRHVGVSTSAWNNAETGDVELSKNLAIKIANMTGVTTDWLFLGRRAGLPAEIAAAIARQEKLEGD